MPPIEANQNLCQELTGLVARLEHAASEVLMLTQGCKGGEITNAMKLIAMLYEDADRIAALADQVSVGNIVCTTPR